MGEVVSSLNENFRRESGSFAIASGTPQNLAFGASLKLRYARLLSWLDDKKRLSRAVNENDILKKALLSPIRQPIEGSRYRIGDCLFEYLPGAPPRRYKICGIQSGGLANVYTVVELDSMQPFCLKENRATFGDPRKKDESLKLEAEISRRLGAHPNLVALHSLFYHRRRVCVVYEYVAGQSLNFHVRRRPLNPPTALKYAADICRAMVHAGEKIPGFVHGDIKPGNCLVTHDGRLKLADFGHASDQPIKDETTDKTNNARRFGGTFAYMSPELFGAGRVDRRLADVYAFGVTFYEMLVGSRPFDADSRDALIEQIRAGDLKIPLYKLEELNTPASIVELIARCLDQQAARRPANFNLIFAELQNISRLLGCPPPVLSTDWDEATANNSPQNLSGAQRSGTEENPSEALGHLKRRHKRARAGVTVLNRAGKLHRAEVFYKHSLRIDKWQKDAYEGLCRLYLNRGMFGKAHKIAGKALESDIHDAFFHQIRGNFFLDSGNTARAVESFKKALLFADADATVQLSFIKAVNRLAAANGGSETPAEVEKLLRAGVEILRSNASTDARKRDFVKNLLALSCPEDQSAAVLFALDDALAACLASVSDAQRGALRNYLETAFRRALELKLKFDIYYAIGKIFYYLELYEDCEKTFRLSIAGNGGSENAFYYLGACREVAEDWHSALKFYKAARRFNRHCELIKTGICRITGKINETQSQGRQLRKKFFGFRNVFK